MSHSVPSESSALDTTFLMGVELVRDRAARVPAPREADAVVNGLRERGVLIGSTGPAENVLKIRPPLVFGREHADLLVDTLDEALTYSAGVMR